MGANRAVTRSTLGNTNQRDTSIEVREISRRLSEATPPAVHFLFDPPEGITEDMILEPACCNIVSSIPAGMGGRIW